MNRYPLWKNVLVAIVVLVAAIVALPNVFGDEPALQVSRANGQPLAESEVAKVAELLGRAAGDGSAPPVAGEEGRVLVRFATVDDQLKKADELRQGLGRDYVVALTLASRTPAWLEAIGLKPAPLGLDLRGGVQFLFEVDVASAVRQRLDAYAADFTRVLRDARIRRSVAVVGKEVQVRLPDAADADRALKLMRELDADVSIERRAVPEGALLVVQMTPDQVRARQDFAIQQNTVTLRNRINELGVAETVVQRQGLDRIVVQLPGVQDPAQAERVLGATATLEFRLVCDDQNALDAEQRGRAPVGCELFKDRAGNPILLKRRTIVTGDQLVDASQGFDQGMPAVFVRLDSKGARSMLETTKANLRKPMAVVFVEQKREKKEVNGQTVDVTREQREVINVATINGVFSSNFQITGLDALEARDLALLLRAGALAAPIFKVEERTVGPSLGQENIERGLMAFLVGFGLVAAFMWFYYRTFGLIANFALLFNVVCIMALLSLLGAALTLPGIAGIVLTIGMAVDANVLIHERIREELRAGNSMQASIAAGYDRAFATIADANITTLIAGIVLFAFGNGPVKGFAVTLCLGILTSMFTAIVSSRALINWFFGGRKLERLSV
jgi:preprotein translocase subunit SecD